MNWSPAWYKATTLTERITTLRLAGLPLAPATSDPWDFLQWKAQTPFSTGSYLAQRLALAHVTEAEFRDLLAEPPELIQQRHTEPPAWLDLVHTAFASPPVDLPPALQKRLQTPPYRFLTVITPLLTWAFHELDAQIRARFPLWPLPPLDPTTISDLLSEHLLSRLSILNRTLTLELNLASRQKLLAGDTPSARFESFLLRLQQREVALALLEEYPVLARQLVLRLQQWIATSLEFLSHLCRDWEAIQATFCPDRDPGLLVGMDAHGGDAHQGGRAVRILQFQSGFRLVYKPRPLSVETHFQELLGWLNAHGAAPAFRLLRILDRPTHGWVEFVASHECGDHAAVQRFYERQGAYLALLYALEATDLHSENLIAAGEDPMLIDLEALFHPFLDEEIAQDARESGETLLRHSVLRTCLLPTPLLVSERSGGIDVGGLVDLEGQVPPWQRPSWAAEGTDEQRLVYQSRGLDGTQNCPRLHGQKIPVTAYSQPLLDGFTRLYRLLLQHRAALLAADGPVTRFAHDPIRRVLRSTHVYALLLGNSFHPDLLRDGLRRERFFDQLWIDIPHRPSLARIVAAESQDLQNTDIPLFTTHPDSQDLWTSTGTRIDAFLPHSGLEQVRQKIGRFSEADLELQCWFIRASLVNLAGEEEAQPLPPPILPRAGRAGPQRLLAASRAIGDRLVQLALTQNTHEALWLGVRLLHNRRWVPDLLDMNLYDGGGGVALFLAYLGTVSGEARYTELAHGAWRFVQRFQQEHRAQIRGIGGFTGWGGALYTLTHLNTLWSDPALEGEAEAIVALLPSLVPQDAMFDVLGGAAGCIGGLLNLYQQHPTPQIRQCAIQCGDHLLAAATPLAAGMGWRSAVAELPLAGFAHGNAGMAWALLALAQATGEPRFRDGAQAALAYERHLYSATARNWPDLRDPQRVAYPLAWCHGAPGIGLGRLQMLAAGADPKIEEELAVALETTRERVFGKDHSLCHGDLGRIELLLQAGRVLGEARWREQAYHLAGALLDDAESAGWRCGIPGRLESPGLLTGLAGIGYELLRLAAPDQVPSVLVLEAPRPEAAP